MRDLPHPLTPGPSPARGEGSKTRPTAPTQLLITRRRGEWFSIGQVVRVKVVRTDVRRQCDVVLMVAGVSHFLGGLELADAVLIAPERRKHLGSTALGYSLRRIPLDPLATWHACDDGRIPECRFSISRLGAEVSFLVTAERHVRILRGELSPDPDPDGGGTPAAAPPARTAARPLKPKPRGFWDDSEAGAQTDLPPRRRAA